MASTQTATNRPDAQTPTLRVAPVSRLILEVRSAGSNCSEFFSAVHFNSLRTSSGLWPAEHEVCFSSRKKSLGFKLYPTTTMDHLRVDVLQHARTVCTLLSATLLRACTPERLPVEYDPNERRPKLRRPTRFVSRLYPTPLPRPISIQYSVTWRPTSSLSPCDTTGHLFALGPISVFVSRYTWYECAAGREKQSKNLIENTYF